MNVLYYFSVKFWKIVSSAVLNKPKNVILDRSRPTLLKAYFLLGIVVVSKLHSHINLYLLPH